MKHTKRALLTSAIALLLCITMLIGTTWAWFTDNVTSAGNKIQTGSLKVDLELLDKKTDQWNSLKDSEAPIFNYDKWEPGYVDVKVLKIENEGTLALKWYATFVSETPLTILSDVIDVYVCPSETELGYPADRELTGYKLVGTLTDFVNTLEKTTYGSLQAGGVAYLGIALKMRENAGNEYQDLSLGGAFDIRIHATQFTFEKDSFDETYDEMAREDVMVSRTQVLAEDAEEMSLALFYTGEKLVNIDVPASALVDPTQPVTFSIDAIEPNIEVTAGKKIYSYDIKVSNLRKNITSEDEMITVVLSVPKGLPAVEVFHKDELIADAVYDAVAGTVTFKTASFSPYSVSYNEANVENLQQLREAAAEADTLIKLKNDITIDLSKGSDDRVGAHEVSGYYNAVDVTGQNVTIDLNGKTITLSCGDAYNSNSDVGALFFVGANGNLKIKDDVGGGKIVMKNSVYAVWAPYKDPSFVDIFGGIFVADSYAGDPLHRAGVDTTPDDEHMPNENSCRCLIYAGTGGKINVYGGYFFYNNTPNDTLNRNNGAFNCTNGYEGDTPLITIHDGVMLIDETYRQDPTYTSEFKNILKKYPDAKPTDPGIMDNSSIKLAEDGYEIKEVTLAEPIVLDGKEYFTWHQVQKNYYNLIFKDIDGNTLDTVKISLDETGPVTVDAKDDTARGKLTGEYATDFGGWVNTASEPISTIPETNTADLVLYPSLVAKYTVRWVDENGNVIASAAVKKDTKYSSLTAPTEPKSQYDNMTFDHWEIRETDANGKVTYTAVSNNYKITKDVTIYPYYTYNGGEGSIALMPHDDDGDGRPDRYTVEAATGLKGSVTIPGVVNGVPVTVITDLSGDIVNGLLGGGVTSVTIKDGVQEIGSNAFAGTAGLKNVKVPASVTSIGSNAFSSNAGVIISKKVTIEYAGTWAQWQAACNTATSDDTNWDSGLGKGSTVICTDGTYVLDAGRGDTNHTWNDWIKQ